MARALAGIGVRVLEFGGAEDALRAIRGDDHELALLVADLLLPGLAGTELAAAIRDAHPTCPAILVTSAPGDARVDEFMRGGGRVLLKPFRMAALVEVARLVVSAASRTAQRHGPTRAAITS
jgi:DNA-binding response OmpR family regulator